MRRVARFTALGLDGLVLENEWSLLVHMACEADSIPRRGRSQLLPYESSMGIMTIRALHQSFLDTMVEGHVELRLHL